MSHISFLSKTHLKKLSTLVDGSFSVKTFFFQKQPSGGVLKNFAKFTGKQLCRNLFLFSCEFFEIFKNIYFYRPPLVAVSIFLTKIGLSLHKKMKFSIKDFFQIRGIFCAMYRAKKIIK